MTEEDNIEDKGVAMINLSLSTEDSIDYTVHLRVIGMMCQRNCGRSSFSLNSQNELGGVLYFLLLVFVANSFHWACTFIFNFHCVPMIMMI